MSSIPGLGRSSEVGDGNPFQILAWRIPRTEQPGGLQSRASQTVGHDSSDLAHMCNRQMATSDFWVSLCCSGKQNASACSVMYNLALQWTVVHQDPLFMVFSRQEYQSRLLFPTAGDISHPWNGIHVSYIGRRVLYHCTTWDALRCISACVCVHACVHWVTQFSWVAQSCPTLCSPMDFSLPGSSVHGIFQAKILELPFPSPSDLPGPGTEPAPPVSPTLQADSFPLSHCRSPRVQRGFPKEHRTLKGYICSGIKLTSLTHFSFDLFSENRIESLWHLCFISMGHHFLQTSKSHPSNGWISPS